jgi:hypothetical protein
LGFLTISRSMRQSGKSLLKTWVRALYNFIKTFFVRTVPVILDHKNSLERLPHLEDWSAAGGLLSLALE